MAMVTLDLDEKGPGPKPEGLRRHVTLQNVLMLLLLLFQTGQYWERQQNTSDAIAKKVEAIEVRVLAAEVASQTAAAENRNTYVRRDVIEERLKSIESKVADIAAQTRPRVVR